MAVSVKKFLKASHLKGKDLMETKLSGSLVFTERIIKTSKPPSGDFFLGMEGLEAQWV